MTEHKYHIEVADIVKGVIPEDGRDFFSLISNDCALCGSELNQYGLPIYHVDENGDAIKYAHADILIVKDSMIRAQIEIEEQDRSATKLFGKVLTSAHCKFYQYLGNDGARVRGPLPFSRDFTFIQIVRPVDAKNPERSQKILQWAQIQNDIRRMLTNGFVSGQDPGPRVIEYHLLFGTKKENGSVLTKVLESI